MSKNNNQNKINNKSNKSSNVRIAMISFAIAIVSLLFIIYGINTFYKQSNFNEICGDFDTLIFVDSCPDNDFDCFCDIKGEGCRKTNPTYTECMENYNNSRDKYILIVYIIMSIIGALMVVGSFFISNSTVSFGIMGGGILSILIGTLRNWSNVQDWMRFLILGIILMALVWIGYNKIKDDNK